MSTHVFVYLKLVLEALLKKAQNKTYFKIYSNAEKYGNDRHFMRESKGTSSMHILA